MAYFKVPGIGYFEDIEPHIAPHEYYWLTPYQYLRWRTEYFDKSPKEAIDEMKWLIDKHGLITCEEDGKELYLISVSTIEAFQAHANRKPTRAY